jgi:DNA polymerase-3 subunit alpha
MFVNLGVHSHYSLLMSSISIDDIINHALRQKQKYVILVDINNMYGAMEFYLKATANKLIPIIGLQITYAENKVVLIAKNNNGYHNLVKISSRVMGNIEYDINDFTSDVYVILECEQNGKWLKHHKDVYYVNSQQDAPIAFQECFFENKGDVKYLKALMAIGSDQQLSAFEENHDYDDCYMLNETQARQKFSTTALKNLEHLVNSCS